MRTNKMGKMVACLACTAIAGLVGASSAHAIVYNFKQGVGGYMGSATTYTEYQPPEAQSYNYGGGTYMLVYTPPIADPPRKTGFAIFDLSSISGPVSVQSATMTICVAGDPIRTPGYSLTYNIYPILRSGLNFGNSNGVSQNGALTFNSSFFDSTSPIGWGTSNTGNYGPVAGQDYGLTSIGSFTLTDANAGESFVTFNLSNSAVASWINNPASNLGFVIVADGGGDQAKIYTGNESEVYRPLFSVDVTPIPEPAALSLLTVGTAAMFFRKRRVVARA